MSEIKLSGTMHCWLMAKIEVGGKTYIPLRGVNFHGSQKSWSRGIKDWEGEYDKANPHARVGFPWWHVPTSKFSYTTQDGIPTIRQSLERVMPYILNEWPSLFEGHISTVDQEVTGAWGGCTADGGVDAVTRIAIDFGRREHLWDIAVKPGKPVPWLRHPVVWVDASRIETIHDNHYVVNGHQEFFMETGQPGSGQSQKMVSANLDIQNTVATMFEKSFGMRFPRSPAGPHARISSTLEKCDR